jgi:hypothetical protein
VEADAGEDIVAAAQKQLDAARAERDSAIPPEKTRVRLSQKIREKESKVTKACDAENLCKERALQAAEDLQKATEHVEQRRKELDALKNELARIAEEEDAFSCEAEDEGLPEEFKGNVEVVRLFRRFEAAKAKHREGGPEQGADGGSEADVEFSFREDEFSDNDLSVLGATGDGIDAEQRLERKQKLASLVQESCNKKLRSMHGTGIRRKCSKR